MIRSKTVRLWIALAVIILPGVWLAIFLLRVPQVEIIPARVFIDQNAKILLHGFARHQPVTVRVWATNDVGQIWESQADFVTDWRGRAEVTSQTPRAGTFHHADAAGFFWSMSLAPDEKLKLPSGTENLQPIAFQVSANVNSQTVAVATLQRYLVAPGLRRIAVHEGELRGVFYAPAGTGPHPAVLLLGGSEGGLQELPAAFLASKGYATLVLAYFSYADLPKTLDNIPLEYFAAGLNWLALRPEVRPTQLAVMGVSRGGELALLLGSKFPQIKAVIAIVPSGILWGALDATVADPNRAAWTYQGKPLPFLGFQDLTPEQQVSMALAWQTNPADSTAFFDIMLENQVAVDKASIPVENISGPVLLISGDDDQVWPSTKLSDMVMERLKRAQHPFADRHLAYAGTGHYIPLPNFSTMITNAIHPVTGVALNFGGDPEHIARASADAWAQMVTFLKTCFPQ